MVSIALQWLFGISFAVVGIQSIFETPAVGIACILGSFFLIPPIYKWLQPRLKLNLSTRARFLLAFSALVFIPLFGIRAREDKGANQTNKMVAVSNESKPEPKSSAPVKIVEPELSPEQAQQREHDFLDAVKRTPASNLESNLDFYTKLLDIRPNNEKYKEKVAFYTQKIQEEKAFFGDPPVRSEWDGSYYPVQKYLKMVMNDPDSLEFVNCTKPGKIKQGWLVGCAYRGNNAFGAKILSSNWFIIRNDTVIRMANASEFSMK